MNVITTLEAANVRLEKHQRGYSEHEARTHAAHSALLASAYRTWCEMEAGLGDEAMAALYDRYGLPTTAPRDGASPFSHAIKLFAGRWSETEQRTTLGGEEVPVWTPDKGWCRWTCVWDRLAAAGEHADFEQVIEAAGGASAIKRDDAEHRKQQQEADEAEPRREEKESFLGEAPSTTVNLPAKIDLAGVGETFTLLCRKAEDGKIVVLGVAQRDASSALRRLARAAATKRNKEAQARKRAKTGRKTGIGDLPRSHVTRKAAVAAPESAAAAVVAAA